MTSAGEPITTSQTIAEPYGPDPRSGDQRLRYLLIIGGMSAFCLFYGIAFALFAPALLLPLITPLPLMAIVLIWALPDTRAVPTRTMTRLTFVFFVGLIMWPNYIAFAPPGLPWITMVRLTGFPLVLTFLICVSVSEEIRNRLWASINSIPLLWKVLIAFVVIQTISIGFSPQIGFSIDKWVVAQVSWTSMFFMAAYVFLAPGRIEKMAGLLWAMTIPVGIIGILEWRNEGVLWAGHIPSFLQINDPSVVETLTAKYREGSGEYRTHSTFLNSLALGEYLALTLPFIIHFVMSSYNWLIRAAGIISIPFVIFIVYITGSRLSVVGCMVSFMLYAVAWAVLYWRGKRDSILAPAFLLALPIALGAALALILFWTPLHTLALGGSGNGGSASSTAARQAQLALAIPKFLARPWGYGIGNGATTVGFTIQNGNLTLDSYYITVLIEYGLHGFIVYYGLIALAIYYAGRNALRSVGMTREFSMLIPLSIALANFFIIKSVFSQQDNHAIVFMFLGMIAALSFRIREQAATDAMTATTVSTRTPRRRARPMRG
jgi:hypothetical protein